MKISKTRILQSKELQPDARQWALDNIDYLNSPTKLLGSSVKVEKGEKQGYYTAVLYLQPAAKVSKRTLCAGAKLAGCERGCLISSGQLGLSMGQRAATRRTVLYVLDRNGFIAQLRKEIEREYKRRGDKLAVRLNGTSDIDFTDLIASLPYVRFYDYTKIWARVERNSLPNYDLTYSGSAYNEKALNMTARAVTQGARVAIAFNTAECIGEFKIPSTVMDFDSTDLRFLDKPGLGGLSYKGGNKKARQEAMDCDSFFFTPKAYDQLLNIIARG